MTKKAKAEAAPKRPTGRPSLRTPEIEAEICERLANGVPLAEICRGENMPCLVTVWNWQKSSAEFSESVARAREAGYDRIAVDALRIADTQEMGVIRKIEGAGNDAKITETEEDMLGHRKLQIETRLKLLACWDPRRYGNKLELAGQVTIPGATELADAAQDLAKVLGEWGK